MLLMNSRRKKNIGDSMKERKSRGYGATLRDPYLLEQSQNLEDDPYVCKCVNIVEHFVFET